MHKSLAACLAASSILAVGAPAAAQDIAVFKPAGPWTLDYGDDYCRLMRPFSDGKNELALAFERAQPGPFMRMIMVTDSLRAFRRADEFGWNFAPGQSERKARYAQSKTADNKDYYNFGPVTVAAPAAGAPPSYDRAKERAEAKPLTAIEVSSGLLSPIRVETGSLEAPMGALQACADDLAKTWGIDPAKLADKSVPAVPEGGGAGWLPQGMVPFTEFAKLAAGANQVRLLVDAAGKPTSCHIQWPTLSEALNRKICATLMDKAKFTPARDPEGNAMAGFWFGSPMFLGPPPPGGARRGG